MERQTSRQTGIKVAGRTSGRIDTWTDRQIDMQIYQLGRYTESIQMDLWIKTDTARQTDS